MAEKYVRCAVQHPTRIGVSHPVYGVPQMNGTMIDREGRVHAAGTWFPSRPASADDDDNTAEDDGE